ncbi:MAG: insulinase family protein [Clostridia bacterium]|nr:insulinase family protein [Clostridia bacterium]
MTYIVPISPATSASDVLLPAVLLRGSEKYPTNADIARRCEQLYGASLGYYYSYLGDSLMINIYADFLSDRAIGTQDEILCGVTELMAQTMLAPMLEDGDLRADEVAKAKIALCDSIRADDNDTAAYAFRRCRELMCGNDPCGYSLSVDDVMRVTPESLSARYFELRTEGHWEFFYVGNEDADSVAKTLEIYFADTVHGAPELPRVRAVSDHPMRSEQESLPVTQGKLTMGIYAGGITMSDSDDYYATLMSVEIFGGSPISKLFMNVRERLGLCYYCGASYNKQKGVIYVSAGIDPKDREAVEREIYAQLEQMKQGNISDAELHAAQLALINSARQISDRPYSMWSFCNIRTMLGVSTSLDHHIERIEHVTVEQVKRVASKWAVGDIFFVDAEGKCEYEN